MHRHVNRHLNHLLEEGVSLAERRCLYVFDDGHLQIEEDQLCQRAC